MDATLVLSRREISAPVLRRQLLREAVVPAFQEVLDLAHGVVVAVLRLEAGAGRVAAVDEVLQARPRLPA